MMYLDVSFLQVVLQPFDLKIYMLGSWVPRTHVACTYRNRRTVVFEYVNTMLWRSHVFQYPHCVEDWSDSADKAVKFSLCCGESYRSLSVALPDNRSTVIENQVSLLTFPRKSIICKTCITRSIDPVLQFRICWYFVADVEVGCTH